MEKKALIVSSFAGYADDIGRFLWCLEDVRTKLLTELTGISQASLDRRLGERQSIGSLLYHIALIEADWLYVDLLGTEWDPEISSLFPVDNKTEDQLSHFEGESLEQHMYRLAKVREQLLSHFRSMDLNQWRKPRVLENYEVTPEWVVYHLIEHESNHRGQIFQSLRELRIES
ncbi:putative damage-inducible protein DinB [Paenibacillus taihuensis]|uniref:Putative damage-inducible protein DinB n=1 Tax=Paenibacillus taihuensis TaxID=1156355 RepID=A0A3D9S6W2_9BACL|nr:DinB family protein [Paenibacillus taihuensis]REE88920.1 putative damage-inducible protein DinB [Paenibacillus taihuensis]